MFNMESGWSTLFLGAFTVVLVRCVAEVYDVTTIHKFDVLFPDNHDQGTLKYVPPCDLKLDDCSKWNVTGWTHSSYSGFSLSEYSGVMSAETEANGSVVCLSLTYRLQPNSGAVIKVLMKNKYNEVIVVGTATAPFGDIQVKSMTTQQFILEVEPDEWTHFTYEIQAERNSLDQTVLISAVSECYDREFPDFRTIGERGTTEIHAMTNARGLPILLPNDTSLSSYVGVNMEECIPLDGGCNWNKYWWLAQCITWNKGISSTTPVRAEEFYGVYFQ